MKPYYDQDGITIYHGDCREVLPGLTSCDLLVADPPYGIGYVTAWRSRSDPLAVPIAGDNSYRVLVEAWPDAMAALATNRHWYCFASPNKLPISCKITDPKQILAWDKGDRGTVGDLKSGFGECWEAILYGQKGRRPLNGPRPRSMIRLDWSGTMDPVHPTVKPVALICHLIRWSSQPSELVLDPFMGSGTTLTAAKLLGRRAIGIEIEERYCEIAAKRLAQGVLFGVGT